MIDAPKPTSDTIKESIYLFDVKNLKSNSRFLHALLKTKKVIQIPANKQDVFEILKKHNYSITFSDDYKKQ